MRLQRGLLAFPAVCIVSLLTIVPRLCAQMSSAEMTGTVEDEKGAVIPGAAVLIASQDTGATRLINTNQDGDFVAPALEPGHYRVTITARGFETFTARDITLHVGAKFNFIFVLRIGDVTESVTVTTNEELVNTTSAEISSVVNEHAITELPLNGRDPSSLVLLSPGTSNVLTTAGGLYQAIYSLPNETGASANGGRQGSTYYLLDDAPNMDTSLGLAMPFPNADATQEFRVVTNNFDAKYGSSPGAVVSIQTRSGTNQFHGGVFEFIRNNDLNAGDYFTHAVDALKRNQFGGELGGPFLKDKLFFFYNYQGTRSVSNGASNTVYTPTAAMLKGDFSAVPQSLGPPFATIAGKPNQVNPALLSKASLTIAETGLPLSQNPASGLVNYVSGTTINRFNESTARIDYNLSSSQRLSLRTFENFFNQPRSDTNGNMLSVVLYQPMDFYNEALSHTWTINQSTVNVFSAFWTQFDGRGYAAVNDSDGRPMCLSRYIKVDEPAGQCFMEGLNVTNGFTVPYAEPSQKLRTTVGAIEFITSTFGKHTLSAGMDVFHHYVQVTSQYPAEPIISFSGIYTGFGLADFLLGDVSNFTQGTILIQGVNAWQIGLFIQDQFRLHPNLTITAGVRWDPDLAPPILAGQGAAFHLGQHSTVFPNAPVGLVYPGDPGVGPSLRRSGYRYFDPRIGVAWQPSWLHNTSLRAAFGLFQAPLLFSEYAHTPEVAPFDPVYTFPGTPGSPVSFQDPYASYAGTSFTSPFPPFPLLNRPPANSAVPVPVTVSAIFANNFKLGITQSWSVSVEHQLASNLALHLAYIGSETYHQEEAIDQNPGIYANSGKRTIYPNFGGILTDFSNGTASYNSLQVGIDQHLTHGLQFQSYFTWSKAIDLAAHADISIGFPELGNPFSLRWNRGVSAMNVPLNSITNFVYVTPALEGSSSFVKHILGSWQASGILTFQSGSPFSITGGSGNNSGALQNGDRADFVPGQPLHVHQGGKNQWLKQYFNPLAFTANAPGTFGNTGKDILAGPAVSTADLGIAKNWALSGCAKLQLRWEAFNALNHASFSNPVNNPQASNFGQITSIGAIKPRVMQGSLKLTF